MLLQKSLGLDADDAPEHDGPHGVCKEATEAGWATVKWVPIYNQVADPKAMNTPLFEEFASTGHIGLTEAEAERQVEAHCHELRQQQRARRKARFRDKATLFWGPAARAQENLLLLRKNTLSF